MDNPEKPATTTINVKAVRESAWAAAKKGAAQQGDGMGTWLSDAIDQRVKRDANQIEMPGKPGANPGPIQGIPSLADLAGLMHSLGTMSQGLAALGATKGAPKGAARQTSRLIEGMVRELFGPALPTSVKGKELTIVG